MTTLRTYDVQLRQPVVNRTRLRTRSVQFRRRVFCFYADVGRRRIGRPRRIAHGFDRVRERREGVSCNVVDQSSVAVRSWGRRYSRRSRSARVGRAGWSWHTKDRPATCRLALVNVSCRAFRTVGTFCPCRLRSRTRRPIWRVDLRYGERDFGLGTTAF